MRDPRFTEQSQPAVAPALLASVRERAHEIAVRRPDVPALRTVCHQIRQGWDEFYDEFASQATLGGEEHLRAWIVALRAAIRGAVADTPGLASKSERESIANEIEAWRASRDPLAIWGFVRHHVGYRTPPFLELRCLLVLDPCAWLAEFDALPAPSLMWIIVWLQIVEDPDLIEYLMSSAPPLFDSSGAWTRSAAAPIFARVIKNYAEHLYEALRRRVLAAPDDSTERATAERDLAHFRTNELPARLRQFYGVLLARADGRVIAFGLVDELASGAFHTAPAAPMSSWSAAPIAFEALSMVLGGSGASIEEFKAAWWNRNTQKKEQYEKDAARPRLGRSSRGGINEYDGEGQRTLHAPGLPLLLGATAVLTDTVSHEADLQRRWNWFEELLRGRDPGIRLASDASSRWQVTQRLGALLAGMTSSPVVWRATFRALEPLRRRAQFAIRYDDDSHQDSEDVLLVYVGLHASAYAAGSPRDMNRRDGHDLFWSCYDAARRLWLTAAIDAGNHKRELVAACFAFLPAVFGADLGAALARALRPIANDSWLLCRACCYLRKSGVAPDGLELLLRANGVNLKAALSDARDWSTAVANADEFPVAFVDLAADLGRKADDPGPPAGSAQPVRTPPTG